VTNIEDLRRLSAGAESVRRNLPPKWMLRDAFRHAKLARDLMGQVRIAERFGRPSVDASLYRWQAEKDAAPVATRRAVESLLSESRAGAARERRMLRLTVINVVVAVIATAAAIASLVFFVVSG
jgi:hypothetical protein